ncbi:MAG: hypothetical protein ACRD3C_22405 [Vicinamibacterales bacterium]
MTHPNLVWQVRSTDGRLVSCLLARCAQAHTVIQYVDEIIADVEEFDDVETARERVRALYQDTAHP